MCKQEADQHKGERIWETHCGNVCENCNQVSGDECDLDRAEISDTHIYTCESWNYGGQ